MNNIETTEHVPIRTKSSDDLVEHQFYKIVVDRSAGLVRVVSWGIWSLQVVDQYLNDLEKAIDNARASFGKLRVLADSRQSNVQPAQTAERFLKQRDLFDQPGDRFAVICDSSLAKMQAKRVMEGIDMNAFLSPSAAETWILAY